MMDAKTRHDVRERAGQRCEYCQLHQDQSPLVPLQIEHVVPKKHGGTDTEDNLALACIDCNLAKSSNLTGIDPDTGRITVLFHPRTEKWSAHFEQRGLLILGKTDVGRTTVRVLNMNADEQLQLRDVLRGT